MNDYAPIVLFTYKRLPILKKVINSLKINNECRFSKLIVYSDGPKSSVDEATVKEVRSYLMTINGFAQIEYIYRDKNLGLAQSFIRGITETFKKYDKAIFLEDDNLLSEHFLLFMNQALVEYADNPRVICVTGYSFPIWPKKKVPYFIRGAETWSMATWRRGWAHFNEDGAALLHEIHLKNLRGKLSRDGFRFYEMLQNQIAGKVDSWGVRWVVSAFVKDLYCLYPNEPLCVSIGSGPESVHSANFSPLCRLPEDLLQQPIVYFPKVVKQAFMIELLLRLMNEKIRLQDKYNRILRSK
jgi:hypothetical protein